MTDICVKIYRFQLLYAREYWFVFAVVVFVVVAVIDVTYLHQWCQVIICVGNGLASIWCQATTWTNAALLPMGHGKKFRDNWFNTWGRDKMAAIFQTTLSNTISWNEDVKISANISLNFVRYSPVHYNLVFVQIMAWCLPGDKPLSAPMMVRCVLKVLKFKHDFFGKCAFAVCGPLSRNLGYAMKLKHSSKI